VAVDEAQSDLLARLRRDTAYPRDVIDLFHDLRRVGNEAVHQHRGDYGTALTALKVARQLAVWFHRTFGDCPSSEHLAQLVAWISGVRASSGG
jgi:type I restriction enzyme R subunit